MKCACELVWNKLKVCVCVCVCTAVNLCRITYVCVFDNQSQSLYGHKSDIQPERSLKIIQTHPKKGPLTFS